MPWRLVLLSKFRSRLSTAHLIALVALFFAIGGPSFAANAVKSAAHLITGKQIKDSSITTKDVKNGSLLKKDFKAGQLPKASTGPQGVPGQKGDRGSDGAPATALWAVINSNGTVGRASGHYVSSEGFGGGKYEVIFDRDVTGCAYVGSLGDPNGVATDTPGFFSAVRRNGNPNGVYVGTANSGGTATIEPFDLSVFC
jgi:hypothetical protein